MMVMTMMIIVMMMLMMMMNLVSSEKNFLKIFERKFSDQLKVSFSDECEDLCDDSDDDHNH